MLEIITGLSASYLVISLVNNYIKEKKILDGTYKECEFIENKDEINGIVLKGYEKNMSMPFYVNTGNSVGISLPIGGGKIYEYEKELYSIYVKKNKNDYYENFECLDKYSKKYYINTADNLNNTLEQYNIDKQKFPIQLPIAVYNYNLRCPNYIIYGKTPFGHNIGIIGSNKRLVIKKYVFNTRFPLTYTAGIISFLSAYMIWNQKYRFKY
jgi:hypothetical protein